MGVKCFGYVKCYPTRFSIDLKSKYPFNGETGKFIISKSLTSKAIQMTKRKGMKFQMIQKVRDEKDFEDIKDNTFYEKAGLMM